MSRSGPPRLFRSILCPIDFSDRSASALRYAAALKRRTAGRLTAFFALDPRLIDAALNTFDERGLRRTSLAQLRRFVSATLPRGAAADVRCVTTLGTPAGAILATSARLHPDLIVIGTHGLSGARKLFLGSTTDTVLRASGVPTLAVPASCSSPPRGWPGRFLVALDLDDATAAEMDAAARIAAAFESPLLAVHVLAAIALPPWLRGNQAAYETARESARRRRRCSGCLCPRAGGSPGVCSSAIRQSRSRHLPWKGTSIC